MAKKSSGYLLGYSKKETARLEAQAALWDPVAHALFDRLGVRPGWRVLEIGPGSGTLHRELRRRVRGPVDAVERAPDFEARAKAIAQRDRLGEGHLWLDELADARLPERTYDLVFARWVFLFLPRPERCVRQLVRALKPGGVLAIEDYHRATLDMVPRPPEWERFLAADLGFFAQVGGDASVGSKLPELFLRAGLTGVEVLPTLKVGAPGSPTWEWLSTYFLGVMERYGGIAPFTPALARSLRRRWLAAQRRPGSLLIAPALLDVVGRKPR